MEPEPPRPSPLLSRRPVLHEAAPPDVSALLRRRRQAVGRLLRCLPLAAGLAAAGVLLGREGDAFLRSSGPLSPAVLGSFLVAAGLVLAAVVLPAPVLAWRRIRRIRQKAAAARAEEHSRYRAAVAAWHAQIDAHDAAERRRWRESARYFPVSPAGSSQRIDVVGGTGDGWASLLTTVGASALARRTGVALLDLSERQVGTGLALLAERVGLPVELWELPRDLGRLNLLGRLDPPAAAELLADALAGLRRGSPDPLLRALDVDLLTTVGSVLGTPVTPARLAAGLRVLEGLDDGTGYSAGHGAGYGARPPLLTPDEVDGLVRRMDAFGRGERTADELRFVRSCLELLAGPADGPAADPGAGGGEPYWVDEWWPVNGLRILATSSRAARAETAGAPASARHTSTRHTSTRHKEMADHLLAQVALHRLRGRHPGTRASDMLVIAGADHLGRATLDSLARHADIAGVRLVLLFERLADDAEKLLGGHDGATVIMRLGNAAEAARAADFVGRGYRFVLSQVTEQVGRSFTAGDSVSVGHSSGDSTTTGTSGGRGRTYDGGLLPLRVLNTSSNTGWQESVTASRSETWQRTANYSWSDSASEGATRSRVHEYMVEPTTIQTLPATAFLLVNPTGGARRVVSADCNPGTVLLDQVADAGHGADESRHRPGAGHGGLVRPGALHADPWQAPAGRPHPGRAGGGRPEPAEISPADVGAAQVLPGGSAAADEVVTPWVPSLDAYLDTSADHDGRR